MRPFLHNRLQHWTALLQACSAVLAKHHARDLTLLPAVGAFLAQAIQVEHDLGCVRVENQLLALRAQFDTALHGIDPLRLEPVRQKLRTMQRTTAMRVLGESGELLRADWERDQGVLDDLRGRIAALLLRAFEQGLVDEPDDGNWTQQRIERLWNGLRADARTAAETRAIQLDANPIDTVLLLGDLLAQLPLAG